MPVNIRGKQYLTVAERVASIHKDHSGDISIQTEIVEHTRVEGKPSEVLIKATVTIASEDFPQVFTDYAHEVQNLTNPNAVNATSYIENGCTSAIGRALAAAGYAGSEYASADEVDGAIAKGLQKENEELQRRLDKAIQIFRNQRKEIEALKHPQDAEVEGERSDGRDYAAEKEGQRGEAERAHNINFSDEYIPS